MYSYLKKLLFCLDPEQSHHLSMQALQVMYQLGLTRCLAQKTLAKPRTLMGLTFTNPIGLAAGLDKNADYVDALAALGFGFIEVGTVTPRPQSGNPRPRLFRLVDEEAIINRMGFNNKGVDYVAKRLEKTRYRGVLGINLGKNRDTPLEKAVDDYLFGFRALWKFASYITINISSPNTPGLRDLQQGDKLQELLTALKQEQRVIAHTQQKYVPLLVKISPDVSDTQVQELAQIFLQQQVDGVIATNTTLSRTGVEHARFANEVGGLSGKPLRAQSTHIIKQLHTVLQKKIPIIAVGGILDVASAQEKIAAGASLLQIYTGFIYRGPALISALTKDINIKQ